MLYPLRGVDPEQTLGRALMMAKGLMGSGGRGANAQRYTLFGDPATRLPHPDDTLGFATGSLDTLRTGRRHTALVNGGGGDTYSLLVADSKQPTVFTAYNYYWDSALGRYVYINPTDYTWLKPGATVFRGTGTAGAGDLAVPFKAPLQLRLGEQGRVRLIVDDADGGRTAVATVPVVSGGTGPSDDLVGPDIVLGFEDDRYRVQPGTQLEVALEDTSGIAILGTSPGNSILLEFDDSGFMTNVTDAFAYDPDSYTSGSLGFGAARGPGAGAAHGGPLRDRRPGQRGQRHPQLRAGAGRGGGHRLGHPLPQSHPGALPADFRAERAHGSAMGYLHRGRSAGPHRPGDVRPGGAAHPGLGRARHRGRRDRQRHLPVRRARAVRRRRRTRHRHGRASSSSCGNGRAGGDGSRTTTDRPEVSEA